MLLQYEFLMSAFENFAFLKVKSTFGVVSLVLAIILILSIVFRVLISWWKICQIVSLKKNLPSSSSDKKKLLKQKIIATPHLRTWYFLVSDYSKDISNFWMYFGIIV